MSNYFLFSKTRVKCANDYHPDPHSLKHLIAVIKFQIQCAKLHKEM